MAVYKVPQDVEADDKLIGPFSFRQFIYLIVVAMAGAAAWGLYQLFPLLIVIPLPIIVFFGALALPLRKDQPMEIYLAALISFYLKPRQRLWDPDGIDSLIEITVPKVAEFQRTKDISQSEAEQRFGYLAELVDSQGWAVRGMGVQAPNSAMNSDVYFAAQQTEDILDNSTTVSQALDYKLNQSDVKHHQDMIDRMHQQVLQPAPVPPSTTPTTPNPYDFFASQQASAISTPVPPQVNDANATTQPTNTGTQPGTDQPTYNPYPTSIQQTVIQPLNANEMYIPPTTVAQTPSSTTTSEKPISPDIMNLATNADLSIETIAREANRIHEKEDMNEEVIISLR